jgi:type II secretory pathway predicted ATPase ExeA
MQEPDDFTKHASKVLAGEPELLNRLLSLRSEVQMFTAQRMPASVPPPAEYLNARNQHLLEEAALLLGPDKFEKVFGFKPDEKINLVDPSLYQVDR